MAENPGLENHRIKSFKNKGRDVEVSVPAPAVGAEGRGPAPGWLARSRRLAAGRSWPPPPVSAAQGWAERATGRGPARAPGNAGVFGPVTRARPAVREAGMCSRGGVRGRRPRGPGMLRPEAVCRAGEGAAAARARRRWSLLGAFTPPHMEPRLCRSPRLPPASRAQAGGGGPQRGVGTSRVTDLFEGDGWGRVRLDHFPVFQCCPFDQSRSLPVVRRLLLAFGAS